MRVLAGQVSRSRKGKRAPTIVTQHFPHYGDSLCGVAPLLFLLPQLPLRRTREEGEHLVNWGGVFSIAGCWEIDAREGAGRRSPAGAESGSVWISHQEEPGNHLLKAISLMWLCVRPFSPFDLRVKKTISNTEISVRGSHKDSKHLARNIPQKMARLEGEGCGGKGHGGRGDDYVGQGSSVRGRAARIRVAGRKLLVLGPSKWERLGGVLR